MSLASTFCRSFVFGFRPKFTGTAPRFGQRTVVRYLSAQGESDGRVYLHVPFDDKEEVKNLGARWDKGTKKWFVDENTALDGFEKWTSGEIKPSRNVAPLAEEAQVQSSPNEPEATKKRMYLSVPFDDKEEVKSLGAQWDVVARKWYVRDFSLLKNFEKWNTTPTYLKVPFEDKDEVKALGARFDGEKKAWYVPDAHPASIFEKWLDPSQGPSPSSEAFSELLAAQESAAELLFLKIETTGYPTKVNYAAPPFDALEHYDQARVVAVEAQLCDRVTFKPLDKISLIIRASDFTITGDKFHGISQERSEQEGVDFADAAHAIATILESRPIVMIHNAETQLNVLKSELFRHNLVEALEVVEQTPAICTMHLTRDILGLPDSRGNPGKLPSFKELYEYAMISESQLDPITRLSAPHLQKAIQKLVDNNELVL